MPTRTRGLIFAGIGIGMGLAYFYLRFTNHYPSYRPALASFWVLFVFWGLVIWYHGKSRA